MKTQLSSVVILSLLFSLLGSRQTVGEEGIPTLWHSSHPGGHDLAAPAAHAAGAGLPLTSEPSFSVTAIKTVDANDNPLTPTAGVPFWVEVDFEYNNPVCTDYTIQRVVNGWTNTAAAINWGCGYNGQTFWDHVWGSWFMYKPGVYPITVTVDSGNAITTSANSSKTMTTHIVVGGSILPEWALVDVEFGRTNLGSGTDVIVGTMDDAFDYLHPWFTGNDSLGRPRLIAAVQNALGTGGSPTNDDHSTGVMGIVLARGLNNGDITGLAPDARYISAEFLNRADIPNLPELDILDAANVVLTNGAEIINMPWSYWTGSTTDSETGEAPISALMADYLAYASNIVVVAYVNELTSPTIPTAPGSARNVITVGGLDQNLEEAWNFDNYGPTFDGRCKPDVLGNGATNCIAPSSAWRTGFPDGIGYWGNSFAGPFVTGAAAQMLGYAKHHGLNRDHRLIKALIINSGVTALDDDGSAWTNSPTSPLDQQQGSGILNLQRVYSMYSVGQQPSGNVAVPGFDFTTIYGSNAVGVNLPSATNGVVNYWLGGPNPALGSPAAASLDVTLSWDRHTFWTDVSGDGQIDAGDTFYVDANQDAQDDLELALYCNGTNVAESRSKVDTVQHLHLTNLPPGAYELQVQRFFVANSGDSEPYGLAWYSNVPWTNQAAQIAFTGATTGAGGTVTLQFQLVSGQAGNFQLQSATDLRPPVTWTALNVPATQTGPNTYAMQIGTEQGPAHFFRISAAP